MISVANAPISYGAFELTVGIYPNVPDGIGVLDRVQAAGYAGIDLGPVGYLGLGDEIAENLRSRGLGLTGGYLELPFHDPSGMPAAMAELAALVDVFDAAAPVNVELGLPAPRPTIAVSRSLVGSSASLRASIVKNGRAGRVSKLWEAW